MIIIIIVWKNKWNLFHSSIYAQISHNKYSQFNHHYRNDRNVLARLAIDAKWNSMFGKWKLSVEVIIELGEWFVLIYWFLNNMKSYMMRKKYEQEELIDNK